MATTDLAETIALEIRGYGQRRRRAARACRWWQRRLRGRLMGMAEGLQLAETLTWHHTGGQAHTLAATPEDTDE